MLYGVCDSPDDEFARRAGFLIGKDGTLLEAHPNVNATKYPEEQLERLVDRAS